MKYFEIVAKCGHVGKGFYYEGHLFIKGHDEIEVAKRVKNYARVKKNHKDYILDSNEIGYEEYIIGLESMRNDPYFTCKNIRDQKECYDVIKQSIKEETETQKKYRNKSYYLADHDNDNDGYVINGVVVRNKRKYLKLNNTSRIEYLGEYNEQDYYM